MHCLYMVLLSALKDTCLAAIINKPRMATVTKKKKKPFLFLLYKTALGTVTLCVGLWAKRKLTVPNTAENTDRLTVLCSFTSLSPPVLLLRTFISMTQVFFFIWEMLIYKYVLYCRYLGKQALNAFRVPVHFWSRFEAALKDEVVLRQPSVCD